MMLVSLIGLGVFLFAFATSPWFLLALPLLLIANTFANVFMTMNNIVVQLLVSDEVRGRVSSIMLMSVSLTPLGTVPLARLAESAGAPVAVGMAAALLLLLTLAAYAVSPTLRGMDSHIRAHMR